jgi:hypothetical protein
MADLDDVVSALDDIKSELGEMKALLAHMEDVMDGITTVSPMKVEITNDTITVDGTVSIDSD